MKEGGKKSVNKTSIDINITMFIREGDSPEDEGNTEIVTVPHNGEVEYIYEGDPGSQGYVFSTAC